MSVPPTSKVMARMGVDWIDGLMDWWIGGLE
jgi:hypothetical protein